MSKPNLIEMAASLLGTEAALAEACGVSPPSINAAVKAYEEDGRISAELARDIDHATGGVIPRWMMRPDLWDIPRIKPPKAAPPRRKAKAATPAPGKAA